MLIVEDDRYAAELVEMELEHRGFEVMCAHDGPGGRGRSSSRRWAPVS